MSFNNFPVGYQYYQPKPANQRIWVQGEAGAKSYLVAPNSTVDLWDSEKMSIYIKSADASGIPSIRTIDYKFREEAPMVNADYVTRDELKEFRDYIESKISEIGGDTGEHATDPDDV